MTTTAMKRKSVTDGECPFSAKKSKVVNSEKGGQEAKKGRKLKMKKNVALKQNGSAAGGSEKRVKVKKSKVQHESNEEPGETNIVESLGAPANKLVENFRQKLNQGSVAADVIRHFTQSIQRNPSYAVDFIRAGGTFKPLLKILNSIDKEKLSDVADLLTLIHYILIECIYYDETHADYAAKCAKTILTEHKATILSLLKTHQNESLLIAGFRILKAMLLVDHNNGKDILRILDVCLPEMQMERFRESFADGIQESVRSVFVDFNLCFLIDTSPELVRTWLSRFLLLSPLVRNLVYDRPENVILVMKTFQQYILESHKFDKYIYRTTFSTDILKALANVYAWVGPAKEEVDPEMRTAVLNASEDVILPLLTSKKYHLVPKTVDLGHGVGRQIHILLALKNTQLNQHQKKLVLKMFEACPQALPSVMDNFASLLKSKRAEHREFVLEILQQPQPQEITKHFTTANAKQVSNFVVKSTLPRTALEFITFSIDRKNATVFCFRCLAIMLNQCEKYLQEIPKLKNLDQFDRKKIKFDVINQILALFPTIDAIMSAMIQHRSNQQVPKPFIAMEHAMDILLVCIRTFPSYIESSSFITAYRKILDPVYPNKAIEHEYLPYEFKAIKVVIALEPQSIALNSELFPSVLKLLTKVYLNGSPEMQRESTALLLALFKNTTLFGNNPTEIEIWFQSLHHADPYLVPELVAFLAFSFRQASERQNLPTEKDHSLVNEAFEKVRQSDLDELFARVEAEASGELDQEETVELPVADNFLIYVFHPSTKKLEYFHPYLEAVALRYFHLLPHPEIVENCAKNVSGQLQEYFSKWIVDGEMPPLDDFGEKSALGRLSRALLKKKTTMEKVLPEGPANRCELTYLIHETTFHVTRLVEIGKFDSSHSAVCSFYLNNLFDLLLAEEADIPEEDQKLGEVLKNIFYHRPIIYQHFSISKEKSEVDSLVTNFIYELMKKLQSVPNFSKHTTLYSNKIVNEIISSSIGTVGYELDSTLVEKLLQIFELNERHCASLLKHYSKLSHREFINQKNEKTYHFNLLTVGLQTLAGNRDYFLDVETMGGLSKIYVDFIRENGNELNLEALETALLSYLDVFSHNIGHLDKNLFRCFFESKRLGKPMNKLAVFLLGRDSRLHDIFLELLSGNVSKKELIYPLMNAAFEKGVFKESAESHKKLLTVVYNEFKSGLNKTIEKPGKAAVIYKENSTANQQLIRWCMPKNECVDFAKKKLKIDSLEIYQLKLMMEIYQKALESTRDDATQIKVIYLNVFNVLLQFFNILLKVGDLLKEIDKLNELVLATFCWVQLRRNCKHLKNLEYKELTESSNWTNFCKLSLKAGLDIQKIPDQPNRYDDRLHVLLKITAILVKRFYKDNSSTSEIATFYDLALSHSRSLDVLLVPFQFKIKTSLAYLLLILARKNPTVMNKKHIPLLLGSYGATLTESNRCILALIQHYERSGLHMHEYQPFLWGETAIKHFSLGLDATEQQTLNRASNVEVFSLLSKEKLVNTLHSFPAWRKLDAEAQLPDMNFDDMKQTKGSIGQYSPQTKIERFVEEGRLKTQKTPVELLESCTGKKEVLAAIYDPAFLLPLLGYLFAPENYDMLHLAGKCGALAIPFVCLASEDEQMRLAAASTILRIKGHLEMSRKFIDLKFWLHLFTAVQNGVATLSRKEPSSKGHPKTIKKQLAKPAFLPSLFVAETINILPDVLNVLHSTLTHYFLLKDAFDFKAVPNFLVMFHSPEVMHNSHRMFILETIYNGIKTHDDFMVLRFTPVIRALLDFYGSPLSNRDLNVLILNTLNSIVKIPRSCEVMINAIGFFTWMSERIEGIESFHFDTIEAFLGIISNAWYSAQILPQEYNMRQLSQSVLIMVLKLLPLLSTRSSSKTLTRFLNMLEKTTEQNSANYELVSEEVLELMLAYFEKLFEQQFWYVKYVKVNSSENSEECHSLGSKLIRQGMDESTAYIILTLRRFVIRWQRSSREAIRG